MVQLRFDVLHWVAVMFVISLNPDVTLAKPVEPPTDCRNFYSPETTRNEGRLARRNIVCVRGEKYPVQNPDEAIPAAMPAPGAGASQDVCKLSKPPLAEDVQRCNEGAPRAQPSGPPQ